jgi:hypothetical protein
LIIETNNVAIADHYAKEVASTSLLSLIEAWAFPTYSRDAKPTADFTLPPSLLLRRTAAEILRELATYNDAYFYYLVATALPLILQRDPTFGLRAPELSTLIETRMSTARLKIPVGRLLDQLHGANDDHSSRARSG